MTTDTDIRIKLTLHLDPADLAELEAIARRRGIKLGTAIARAVRSGVARQGAQARYAASAKGRRAARRYQARRSAARR